MSQIPNLENSPINLTAIRARAQTELENILKNVQGDKCLVVDPKLSGSLSRLVRTSELKKHGTEFRHLTADPVQTERAKVVYLVRPDLNLMRFICSHIHDDISKGLHREYYLYFVPRRLVVCEKILYEGKVHELLNIGEFPLYMIPIDEDVLSFELDLAQKEYSVDGDATSLWHIAKGIHNLEFSFGVIPDVRAKGNAATRVADILTRLQAEEPVNSSDTGIPQINTLILLDREVDMITPLCTQLTYEGLLDEIVGVNNGAVEVDASIMELKDKRKIKVPLNSSDKVFKETRDLHFGVVCELLHQKAISMKQDYTDISTPEARERILNSDTKKSLSEFMDVSKKLTKSFLETRRHTNLVKHLDTTLASRRSFHGRISMEQTILEAQSNAICLEYIKEMIYKQEPLVNILRLVILYSITNSGLPKEDFDELRRELIHSYGHEHVPTLNNLKKAGLFKEQDAHFLPFFLEDSRNNWSTIKHDLELLVDDTDIANPNDISYVFSGYAPLSVRLVQRAMRSGWSRIEKTLRLLPGPHSETKRGGYSSSISSGGRRSLVLVVFVGGVTFAEISALRFLSSQEGMAYDFIVGTTKIVNGQTLIETFVERLGRLSHGL